MPSVLIRVDATKEIALGHLKRCISLALKFREKGVPVAFLASKDNFAEKLIHDSKFEYNMMDSSVNSDDDCSTAVKMAKKSGAGIIIIDSYEIDHAYRKRLIDNGFFVVSIDDIADKQIPSHVIINGNLNAEYLRYVNTNGASMYLGIGYLILGPDFWNFNDIADTGSFNNVLITMGGIDHYDLTSKILRILDRIDADFSITTIIGPYYENSDLIQSQVERMVKKVDLVESPSSLYPYMKRCSMAFSAGGQTLYEFAALGRPTIGITVWENQAGNVSELSKMGAILGVIYSNDGNFDDTLGKSAGRVIFDNNERRRLSDVSSALVDGKGAERTTSAIIEAFKRWSSKGCFTKEII